MCPACIANAALIVTGTVSAGGWTAFALRKPRARRGSRRGPAEGAVAHEPAGSLPWNAESGRTEKETS